jgi:hypothetical protein
MIPPSPWPPFTPSVTRDDLAGLPPGMGAPGMIKTYMPTSHQIGGRAGPARLGAAVDMTFEEDRRFVLTADLGVPAVKGA